MNDIEALESRYNLHLSPTYVERYITPLGDSVTLEKILDRILHQNLKDVVQRTCLPYGLTSQSASTIPSDTLLQITSSRDATQPLRLSVTDEDITIQTAASRETDKRLLKLILSDGVGEICGVELSTLSLFRRMPIPGEKLLVKAGAEVKSGVIVFSETNAVFLGGEVAELKKEYLDCRRRLQNSIQAGSSSTGLLGAPRFEPLSLRQPCLAPTVNSHHDPAQTPHRAFPQSSRGRGRGRGSGRQRGGGRGRSLSEGGAQPGGADHRGRKRGSHHVKAAAA